MRCTAKTPAQCTTWELAGQVFSSPDVNFCNNDQIDHNTIGGPGYTPANTTNTSNAFVIPIDTISFATIHPRVYDNTIL